LIISHKKKFVFIRTGKTASSSMEVYLSQFCSRKDTITTLGAFAEDDEDEFKKKHGLPGAQNYILKKKSFGIKNFLNFNFINNVNVNSHDPIDKVLKSEIGNKIKDYFFFCLIRNPFDWIVRSFWWDLYLKKKKNLNWINNANKNQLIKIFKNFLDETSYEYFNRQKNIVTNNNINIKIYKYEDFDENIKIIKKKLSLNKEKISIKDIRFKKLKIKRKIFIDRDDEKKIIESGEFFFKNYYKNAILPSKYKI
tara:strand:- start:1113 stop:1868 length:756 start_codon:yes stop_codon:yes gene_type:complete